MHMTCYGAGVLRLMSHIRLLPYVTHETETRTSMKAQSQSSFRAQEDGLVLVMNGSYGIDSVSFTRLC